MATLIPNIVPYEAFPTSDGHLVLAVGNDRQWQKFCTAAGRDDLANDPPVYDEPVACRVPWRTGPRSRALFALARPDNGS